MANTIINDLDDSDESMAKEMGLTLPQYRAEMQRRERERVVKAAARRRQARADNCADRRTMKRIILNDKTVELSDEQFERLEQSAKDNDRTVSEELKILVDRALLESDAAPASETGERDEDNEGSRRKERPTQAAAKLAPLTPHEKMELAGKIQNLCFTGRDSEARDLQKVIDQRERYEEKPTLEQERQAFVDSAVQTANSVFGR